jgi:hypothetical protein
MLTEELETEYKEGRCTKAEFIRLYSLCFIPKNADIKNDKQAIEEAVAKARVKADEIDNEIGNNICDVKEFIVDVSSYLEHIAGDYEQCPEAQALIQKINELLLPQKLQN